MAKRKKYRKNPSAKAASDLMGVTTTLVIPAGLSFIANRAATNIASKILKNLNLPLVSGDKIAPIGSSVGALIATHLLAKKIGNGEYYEQAVIGAGINVLTTALGSFGPLSALLGMGEYVSTNPSIGDYEAEAPRMSRREAPVLSVGDEDLEAEADSIMDEMDASWGY